MWLACLNKFNCSTPIGRVIMIVSSLLSVLPIHTNLIAGPSITSRGPAPMEDAPLLFREGKKAYESRRFSDAVLYLTRLTERHPYSEHFAEALYLLGHSYLELGQARLALTPLQNFVRASGNTDSATLGRLFVADTLIKLKEYPKARLALEEIFQGKSQVVPPPLRLEALSLRGLAFAHEGDFQRAALSRDEARSLSLTLKLSPRQKALLALLSIHLSRHECNQYPSSSQLAEEVVLDQLRRRSQCELKTLLVWQSLLESQHLSILEEGRDIWVSQLRTFRQFCLSPPLPLDEPLSGPLQDDDTPLKRTPEQLQLYQRELVAAMKPTCIQTLKSLRQAITQQKSAKTIKPTIPQIFWTPVEDVTRPW